MDRAVAALQAATEEGLQFVFGYVAGGPPPFRVIAPEYTFILAFRALPLILLMSVLSRLLYHWGILQKVVKGFSWVLERTLGVGGALGTSAAANIFLGMVEAPLLIRPYIKTMGRGALFATMTVGMAGVAGTVMALYASFLERLVPGAAGHILVASIMSVPAALIISRIMVPHGFADNGVVTVDEQKADQPASSMDAIAQGTLEGIQLLAYVVAMLIVMIALVSLANGIIGGIGQMFGLTLVSAAHSRLDRGAGRLADRYPRQRNADGGRPDRHQDRAQRVAGLPGNGAHARDGIVATQPADPDLWLVRVRQSRIARHSHWWHDGDGARAACRDRRAGATHHSSRHTGDVIDRRRRRAGGVAVSEQA